MPNYDFRCKKCKAFITRHQGFYDDSIPDCPTCKTPMNKIIYATPAVFRGGGWGGQ